MIHVLKRKETSNLLIALLLTLIIFYHNKIFLRPDNIVDMLRGNTVLAIMALGMLPIVLTGGIDMSVGAMIAATTVLVGKFMIDFTGNVLLAFIIGCMFGTFLGAINGILIAKLKIPSIVATLGTMSIINGTMLYITNGAWINDIPKSFVDFGRIILFEIPNGQGGWIGFPIQILFLVGTIVLTWIILRFSRIGRGIYAMGGNPVSAARIGYDLDKINIFLYSYMGFITGLAAVVHISIMRRVDPNAFTGFELQVIAAVLLGGASILEGVGTVFGTLIGVLLFAIMYNGIILLHVPLFWQKIVLGAIILITISVNVMRRKRNEQNLATLDIE